MSPIRLPGRASAIPAASASWHVSSSRWASAVIVADPERVGAVADRSVQHDADVDRDQIAVLDPVGPGDAVDDHRVRGDADLRGVGAVVALRGRGATVLRDERPCDHVELTGRDARPQVLADVRDRGRHELTGPGDALDLLRPLANDHRLQRRLDLGEDVVDRSARVERPKRSRGPVALDDRLGLLVVDREASCDHLGCVVGAILVARSPVHPQGRRLVVEVEEEDGVERASDRDEHLVELLGLDDVAREAVEHESTRRVVLGEPVADQRDRELVGNELAGGEDRLDLAPELRACCHGSAEHVARRHVRHTVDSGDPLRLRALPGSLRPENEDVDRCYLRKPS